jgi:hypothetical protein
MPQAIDTVRQRKHQQEARSRQKMEDVTQLTDASTALILDLRLATV